MFEFDNFKRAPPGWVPSGAAGGIKSLEALEILKTIYTRESPQGSPGDPWGALGELINIGPIRTDAASIINPKGPGTPGFPHHINYYTLVPGGQDYLGICACSACRIGVIPSRGARQWIAFGLYNKQ